MPVAPPRELKIGSIIEETLGVLERSSVPALLFVVALTLVNGATAYFGLEYTSFGQQAAKGVLGFTIGVAAQGVNFVTDLDPEDVPAPLAATTTPTSDTADRR